MQADTAAVEVQYQVPGTVLVSGTELLEGPTTGTWYQVDKYTWYDTCTWYLVPGTSYQWQGYALWYKSHVKLE